MLSVYGCPRVETIYQWNKTFRYTHSTLYGMNKVHKLFIPLRTNLSAQHSIAQNSTNEFGLRFVSQRIKRNNFNGELD